MLPIRGKSQAIIRTRRENTIFEQGEWTHVAWVWGPRDFPGHAGSVIADVLRSRAYINGKYGRQRTPYSISSWIDHVIRSPLKELQIGSPAQAKRDNLQAFVDELRVSDVQRYTADFEPPSRKVEFEADEHTRALFHFNGTLKGRSHGFDGTVEGVLTR